MIIKDPQNLLPTQIRDNWEMSNLVLEIPPHGIPLHPKSIERLVAAATSGKEIVVVRPTFPIASELGLPTYPTLAYVYPQNLRVSGSG